VTIAFYPGSFDPFTNGHLDVATRAARLFEKVIIGVYATPANKSLMFTTEERVEMTAEAVAHLHNVEVMPYSELTVTFAQKIGAKTVVRGMRTGSDFEHEFDLAMMNRKQNPHVDIVCFLASQEFQFLSSSILKEIARLGGKIDEFVPPNVAKALRKRLGLESQIKVR
jgi:pantetheine-phosphate adenylyltransferase